MKRLKQKMKRRFRRLKPLIKGAVFGALVIFGMNSAGYVPLAQFLPYTVQFKIVPNSISLTMEAIK